MSISLLKFSLIILYRCNVCHHHECISVDHNFFCALLCSACSTTCCCITVWTVESNYDFLRPIHRNRLCISGLGISRQTGFNLEFPSPRWIACQGYELHPPFFRFCLETYKLLGELSAKTMSFPCPASFV